MVRNKLCYGDRITRLYNLVFLSGQPKTKNNYFIIIILCFWLPRYKLVIRKLI